LSSAFSSSSHNGLVRNDPSPLSLPPPLTFARFGEGFGSANISPEGTLNAAYNCLDRHFYANPDKTAIIYEADESSESREISFAELMKETCKIANVLKSWGVKKGDAVSI
jgi:acetyl-CoA synthetase